VINNTHVLSPLSFQHSPFTLLLQRHMLTRTAREQLKLVISIMVEKNKWNEVISTRRTPISKQIERDSQGHWTNSFQLLARVDGNFKLGRVRSQMMFQTLYKLLLSML
jgi:hypothetical protein